MCALIACQENVAIYQHPQNPGHPSSQSSTIVKTVQFLCKFPGTLRLGSKTIFIHTVLWSIPLTSGLPAFVTGNLGLCLCKKCWMIIQHESWVCCAVITTKHNIELFDKVTLLPTCIAFHDLKLSKTYICNMLLALNYMLKSICLYVVITHCVSVPSEIHTLKVTFNSTGLLSPPCLLCT